GSKRFKDVAIFIQGRLEDLVLKETGEARPPIPCPPELEFLIQAIGQMRKVSGETYPVALEAVTKLLTSRARLEDPQLVPSVWEALGELSAGRPADLAPVRAIFKEGTSRFDRMAAARVLGKLHDKDSLNALEQTAKNPKDDDLVRAAAIESLG